MSELKQGIVSEVDPVAAKIKVQFPDKQGMQSYWLPILMPFTKPDSAYVMPTPGESVACLMDDKFEAGWILGQYYDAKSKPPTQKVEEICFSFENGDSLVYNRQTGIATLKVKELIVEALKVDITGLTTIALNTPLLTMNVAQIVSTPSGSYGAPGVQMQVKSLELDADNAIRFNPGNPLTINSKQAAVIGAVDSDNDVIVTSGQ